MRTHTTTPTDAHRRARRVWAAGKMLRWHSLQLSSILTALDRSADGLLSREEFVCGLVRTLGFTGERASDCFCKDCFCKDCFCKYIAS